MAQTYSWPVLSAAGPVDFSELRERARQEGYDEGYQAGHAAALKEAERLRVALTESLASSASLSRQIEQDDQQQLVALIRRLTGALIGVELKVNTDVLEAFIEEALAALNATRESVVLTIAEDDAAWLSEIPGIRVVADADQRPGSFSISNARAGIEFDPLTRLEELLERVGEA